MPSPPRVLASADPWILERALLEMVAEAKGGDPLAPVLVIVPTRRLAAHVGRRLAERLGAVLGVEVLHHRRVALEALEAAGAPVPEEVSAALLRGMLRRTVRRLPDNPWADYLARRPGAAAALLETLTDLREAGLLPEEVRGEAEPALAEVYAAWALALDEVLARGFADGAALVAGALPHVPAWAGRFVAAIHHGAYDLTGLHRDLVQAVARTVPMTLLLPGRPETPGFLAAQRLADAFGRPEPLAGAIGLLGGRTADLGIEEARPAPLPPGTVPCARAPGAYAELTWAVRHALSHVASGTPPAETAILVRGLGPYEAALEQLAAEGIALDLTRGRPLRRSPAVHDLLLLLRAVVEDFPRATVAELVRSPRLRWPDGAASADRWSRRAGLLGGLTEWTEVLPEWVSRPREWRDAEGEVRTEPPEAVARKQATARALGRALAGLAALDRPRRWREHAEAIRQVLEAYVRTPDLPGLPETAVILENLATVGDLLGDDRPVDLSEAVAWLEEAVGEAAVPAGGGGIPVLDMMQARGLTFRRVVVAGLHEGSFPRRVAEDPFLPDDVRRALRLRTGRPLPIKGESRNEEQALLALALGAAGESLELSWQRADETGRERSPSPALREAARVIFGRPDLEALEASARSLPAHPLSWLQALADEGRLAPDEERALLALRCGDPSSFRASLSPSEAAALAAGLDHLEAVESFAPGEDGYDARVGPSDPAPLTVHGLEALGRCPLQYFFRHVLKVREMDDEPTLAAVAREDLGSAVHALLEGIHRTLADEGLQGSKRLAEARRRAAALLEERWAHAVREPAATMPGRLPVLWEAMAATWEASLAAFLDEDLARLAGAEMQPVAFEEDLALEVPGDPPVLVRGRVDRLFRGPSGAAFVGDYKTSGKLADKAQVLAMLRGRALQVPLYHLMADGARVELLGVGPAYDGCDENERRAVFTGFPPPPEVGRGFRETVQVLGALPAQGVYPMRPDRHCAWCSYRPACRRHHAPSADREGTRSDARDARDLARKTTSRPTLDDVREDPEGDEGGEA